MANRFSSRIATCITSLLLIGNSFNNCFSQNIYSVGGYTAGATNGFNSDGCQATTAQISTPLAVDVDAAGNVYFMDAGNWRVRKITPAGIITTIAGGTVANGTVSGYDAGNNVSPTSIIYQTTMYDVDVNSAGDVYFIERNRMRKITTSTNLVNTYAGTTTGGYGGDGGSATAASVRFNFMGSIASDGSGNVYIADRNNHRIRKVDGSGILTTIAGTGTAGFSGDGAAATAAQISYPHGIDVDASGNIYFGDMGNNRVRKISSGGTITTVAGTGTATPGYSGDGAAATAAGIDHPTGIAVDASGNVYFTDQNNFVIRKITISTGFISTVAGNQALGAGYSGDGGTATSAQINLTSLATFTTTTTPVNIAVDASGNLYIPDVNNDRIRKVNAGTGNISTIAGTGSGGRLAYGACSAQQLFWPEGVAVDATGNFYSVQHSGGDPLVYKKTTSGVSTLIGGTAVSGTTGDGGLATAANIVTEGIAVDPSGNVFIAGGDVVRRIDASSGIITTVAGTGTAGNSGDGAAATSAMIQNSFGNWSSIATDPSGHLYIAQHNGTGNERIRKVNMSTGIITTVAGTGTAGFTGDGALATAATLDRPLSVAVDASYNIYICDVDNARIRKVTAATGIISTIAGTGTSGYTGDGALATAAQISISQSNAGIAIDGSGNIFFSQGSNVVRKITISTGIITTVAGNGTSGLSGDGGAATSAQLFSPSGLAIGSSGNCLYIADRNNSRIRMVDFGGSCNFLMPVELLSFEITCDKSNVTCHWSTSSELSNDYFTIEKSTDAKNWLLAGTVPGAGSSASLKNYSFTDKVDIADGLPPFLYYRLKQTDFNGQNELFSPKAADCFSYKEEWSIQVVADASGSQLNASIWAPEACTAFLELIDLQGRKIHTEKIYLSEGLNLMKANTQKMNAGMYFAFIRTERSFMSQKFILK